MAVKYKFPKFSVTRKIIFDRKKSRSSDLAITRFAIQGAVFCFRELVPQPCKCFK